MATDLPDIIQKVVREDLINDEQPSLVSQQLRVLQVILLLHLRTCMIWTTSEVECLP